MTTAQSQPPHTGQKENDTMNNTTTARIQHGQGATVTISRPTPYPAPYALDITWPNGNTERITPADLDPNTTIDGQNKDTLLAYARTFVVETVQSGDF